MLSVAYDKIISDLPVWKAYVRSVPSFVSVLGQTYFPFLLQVWYACLSVQQSSYLFCVYLASFAPVKEVFLETYFCAKRVQNRIDLLNSLTNQCLQ